MTNHYPVNSITVVTGSRDWTNRYKIYDVLNSINPLIVVQGDARGADRIAMEWCFDTGKTCISVPALWEYHGKAAGQIRNIAMLDIAYSIASHKEMAILVAAFPLAQSIGTYACMKAARSRNIDVYQFDNSDPSM